MFKHLLPHEARVMTSKNQSMNKHLHSSPFAPLAIALYTGMTRLGASLRRLAN